MIRLSLGQVRQLGIVTKKKARKSTYTKATWEVARIPGCIKLTIPENMPSLNVWKLWHWTKQAEYKKQLTADLWVQRARIGSFTFSIKVKIQVIHYHRVHRRHDDDNATPKFLGDALKGAGFIAEDNSEVLEWTRPQFEVDKTSWRTEVFIYDNS